MWGRLFKLEPSTSTSRESSIGGWNIRAESRRLASTNLDLFDAPLPGNVPTFKPLAPIVSVECVICRDAMPTNTLPTERCRHRPQTCGDCMTQTLKVAIVNEKISTIPCPIAECSQMLEYDDVKKWADDSTFESYTELLLQQLLREETGYVTCIKPSCGAGQVHGGENIFPIVTCVKCGHKTCFRHRTEWHQGYSCKEWDNRHERWAKENQLSAEWITGQTKRCPGPGCNKPIRKTEGCDHMTCRKPGGCGFEFCWVCLAPYAPIRNEGNHKHKETCIYHTSYVVRGALNTVVPPPVVPPPVVTARTRWIFWRRANNVTAA